MHEYSDCWFLFTSPSSEKDAIHYCHTWNRLSHKQNSAKRTASILSPNPNCTAPVRSIRIQHLVTSLKEQVVEFENHTGGEKIFIRGAWDVLINQTGLTFIGFTEKYDLAVSLYTVPRNIVYLCTVLYMLTTVLYITIPHFTVSLRFTMNSLYFDYGKT
jgi:hypothetical protein